MTAVKIDPQARLAEINERIDWLRDRDRQINDAIGSGLTEGGDVAALRDERREVRDEIEDLVAALPHVERRVRESEADAYAARLQEALATEAGEMERAGEIGDKLRVHLSAVRVLARELAAIEDAHRSTRSQITTFARRSNRPVPAAPDIWTTAGLWVPFAERDLPKIAERIEQQEANTPTV